MEKLYIEETKYTPKVECDALGGTILLSGKSYPENTFEFYQPLIDWIAAYFRQNPAKKTVVNMEIIYFNSSSSKLFFDLFDLLEEKSREFDIEINWIFDKENESAQEAGEDFVEDFEALKFNLVAKD